MGDTLVNKVSESELITLDLEDYFPKESVIEFDLKDYLFMGLILKEREFRESLKTLDVEKYKGKIVAVTCSADAIIPMWAYMLVASVLQPVVKDIMFGNESEAKNFVHIKNISEINPDNFIDKRIVIKGCGDKPISQAAYLEATKLLRPVAKSIMFGEPCSTVPIYKNKG